MAASSHIDVLIHDRDGGDVIPKSVPTGGGAYCAGIQSEETQHNRVSGLALEWQISLTLLRIRRTGKTITQDDSLGRIGAT
jgi:hypothetical protein